jgi:hypothetical protein
MTIPGYIIECCRVIPVGSRITCDPPVLDTDQDFLVLWPQDRYERDDLINRLQGEGWELDGSFSRDEDNRSDPDHRFVSYSRERVNLITTCSPLFFRRFLAASSVAKRFNLLTKDDRIALFQAVLYANACDEDVKVDD